jgi:uncharacterized protein YlaI
MRKRKVPMVKCLFCGLVRAAHGRGLCSRHFKNKDIRNLYDRIQECGARRSEPDFTGPSRIATEPTFARPGSPEKIAVMIERASLGLSLFHPLDHQHTEGVHDHVDDTSEERAVVQSW